jgi:hypothetical protein
MDVTPERPDALELIRADCDRGLRYYTWALERMPSIPEQAPHVNHWHTSSPMSKEQKTSAKR